MSLAIQEMMQDIGMRARAASRAMARASSEQKNQALLHIAKVVRQKTDEIQKVNQVDVERAKANGQDAAFVDRLTMTPKTIETMALGFITEGRRYLTLAIGCTGGKHRSVAITQELVSKLTVGSKLSKYKIETKGLHRDLGREI